MMLGLHRLYNGTFAKTCYQSYGLSGIVGVGVICGVSLWAYNYKVKHDLKTLAAKTKHDETIAIVQKLNELLKEKDEEEQEAILAMTTADIIATIKDGKITSLKALQAFLNKACSVTMELNCITGLIENAEEQARKLKERCLNDVPLYGLPVSVKESMNIQGMDSTIGLSSLIGKPAAEDCVLVQVLKHNGAIPFVKTNLPQLMQCFGGCNPIFGETGNPYNAKFCPGGSTAGESSLIGAGGSPLGFGTDIGGSIRNPSHMCGIAGLKPTMNRISKVGIIASIPGQSIIASTLGPMARDVDTLVLAMRALLCPLMFELDPICPPMPFNDEVYFSKKKLRIGYYVTDGFAKPAPAIVRGIQETKEALEKAGHTLVQFDVPKIAEAMRIYVSALYADGAKANLGNLRHCEVDHRMKYPYFKWKCPPKLRKIISFILGLKWPRIGLDFSLYGGGNGSVSRLWKLQMEASQYKREFLTLWSEYYGGLDALICPPFPVASGPLGSAVQDFDKMMSYTALYNLLDFPAGVVPVTRVTEEDIQKLDNYKGHYGDLWDSQLKEVSKHSLGMPVGVQCVTLPWQDEKCLRVMKEVEHLMR